MNSFLCNKFESKFAILFLILFIVITTGLTIFGISPVINSTFTTAFYIILITGIFISSNAIGKIGIKNFAGKSLMYFLIAILLTLFNIISINLNFNFKTNEALWLIVSALMVIGLSLLLSIYKLNLPKNIFTESIILFLISIIFISFWGGWPQIINALLLTSAIMAIRISGRKTNCGIVFISVGLILLVLSNILFIQRYWSEINYFGDISDLSLLLSWFSIVTGIYFIKRKHA